MKLELYVWLIIPDTTAITAFHTLKRMGFAVKSVKRRDYYSFEVDDKAKDFSEKISKVDVLVNANKHRHAINKCDGQGVLVLVQDLEKPFGLLKTLKERLGFTEIKDMEKGVLWELGCSKKDAEKIAKELLCNEHYQSYRLI